MQSREGLVGDRLFGERVGNGTLGSVLRLGGGLAAGLSWGARGEDLLRNGAGLVRDRLFGERVGNGTLGGVLHLGGGLAARFVSGGRGVKSF